MTTAAGRVKKPDEKLKMPDFGLSEEDAKSLTTALLSLTKEKVDPRKMRHLDAAGQEIEAGWRVIKNRNCQGCHKIGTEGGAIAEITTFNAALFAEFGLPPVL